MLRAIARPGRRRRLLRTVALTAIPLALVVACQDKKVQQRIARTEDDIADTKKEIEDAQEKLESASAEVSKARAAATEDERKAKITDEKTVELKKKVEECDARPMPVVEEFDAGTPEEADAGPVDAGDPALKVGIKECDDYFEKMAACNGGKLPDGMRGTPQSWREMAKDPLTRETLRQTCDSALPELSMMPCK